MTTQAQINQINKSLKELITDKGNAQSKDIYMDNGEIKFRVKSSRDGYHTVIFDGKSWKCTCEYYHYRKGYCRHIKEAKLMFSTLNDKLQKCMEVE